MTLEHMRVVAVVYTSSIVPLLLIPWLRHKRAIPAWLTTVYLVSFVVCALGWEIWFTYGLFGGDPVDVRRAPDLNAAIPMHINWLLNSLADAGTICVGGVFLLWRVFGRDERVLREWHWGAFGVLLLWFLGQNIFVEMFLYHDQLAAGKPLSWAPLVPTGPWFNPTLFTFRDRSITLQGQVAWLLMAPMFYAALIALVKRQPRFVPRAASQRLASD